MVFSLRSHTWCQDLMKLVFSMSHGRRNSVRQLLLSHFSRVRPHRQQPTRLPRPWDSPGKNTGAGCHFFLPCMKVKSESEVAQSYPTLSNPMDCSLPGSSIHGIFQARVLEWGAIAFSLLLFMTSTQIFHDYSATGRLKCLNNSLHFYPTGH